MNKKDYKILSSITIGGIFGSTIANLFFTTIIPIAIGGLLGMVFYYWLQSKTEK